MPTGQTNKIGATRDLNPESQEKPKKWREIGTHKGETEPRTRKVSTKARSKPHPRQKAKKRNKYMCMEH